VGPHFPLLSKISNIGMERWRTLRVAMILVPHFSLHPLITSLPTGNIELKHSAAEKDGNGGKEEE
jgi:hypothetical protein